MQDPIAAARRRSLPRLRRLLLRGWPRVAVGAMLALTTLAGFLGSVALLHLGVRGMGIRYGLAVLIAYAVFLAQLRVWVARARRSWLAGVRSPRAAADVPGDVLDAVDLPAPRVEPGWGGAGGRFAGGGASGSFDARALVAEAPAPAAPAGGGGGGGIDLDVDLGDDAWPLLAVVAIVLMVASAALAAGWVVYSAPTLLAEVFFDGVVSGVLYRRLRRGAAREWWQGALARTWIPALVVLVAFAAGGLLLERAVPGARSIGEVLRRLAS